MLLNSGTSLGYYDPKTAELETIYTIVEPEEFTKRFCPVVVHDSLVFPFMKQQ
jgi:hypothetical protein